MFCPPLENLTLRPSAWRRKGERSLVVVLRPKNTEFLRMSSAYNSETLHFPAATRQYPMVWIPRMSSWDITLEHRFYA